MWYTQIGYHADKSNILIFIQQYKSISFAILINLLHYPILLVVYTKASTPAEPIRTWHTGELSERESDQITNIPIVIIVELLNVSCTEFEWLVHWGCLHHDNTLWCGILDMAPTNLEVTPSRGTLFRVALSFTHLLPDANMFVRIAYIIGNMNTEYGQ